MQPNPNKRRGEERSETLIIPHITKDMVETARPMAEQGASRAEFEAAGGPALEEAVNEAIREARENFG